MLIPLILYGTPSYLNSILGNQSISCLWKCKKNHELNRTVPDPFSAFNNILMHINIIVSVPSELAVKRFTKHDQICTTWSQEIHTLSGRFVWHGLKRYTSIQCYSNTLNHTHQVEGLWSLMFAKPWSASGSWQLTQCHAQINSDPMHTNTSLCEYNFCSTQ